MTEDEEDHATARRERIRRQSAELAARLAENATAAEFFADWDQIGAVAFFGAGATASPKAVHERLDETPESKGAAEGGASEGLPNSQDQLRADALAGWVEYKATGRHATGKAVDAWLARLEAGDGVAPPPLEPKGFVASLEAAVDEGQRAGLVPGAEVEAEEKAAIAAARASMTERLAHARGMANTGLTTDEIMALVRGEGGERRTLADTCSPRDDSDPRHKALWAACRVLPGDYSEYGGEVVRRDDENADYPDCSGGCRYWLTLHSQETVNGEDGDWGVCTNPHSYRTGLLTWEHQGCLAFEGKDLTDEEAAAVAEAYDRMQAEPNRAISADDVGEALREHNRRRGGESDGS